MLSYFIYLVLIIRKNSDFLKSSTIYGCKSGYTFVALLTINDDSLLLSMKTKSLVVRLTPEQDQILIARARTMGFHQRSDYVRFVLFLKMPIEEKINEIHKVVTDGRKL